MKKFIARACVMVLIVIPAFQTTASPLVVGDAPSYHLGGCLEILRDTTGTMGFSQASANSASWKATAQDEPNPGVTTDVFWVRFQLESKSARRILLALNWPLVNLVNLFVIQPDGTVEHMASGDRIPFAERSFPYRYPLFPVTLHAGRPVWCYVQVLDVQSLFPLCVWNEGAFFRNEDHNEQIIFGLFIGLFLVVIIFTTLFFVTIHDKAYLYYVLFALSYVVFEVALRGLAGEYLWPLHTWLDEPVEGIAGSLAITLGLLFARQFLQTRIWAPFLHRFLGVIILGGSANTLFIAFPSIAFATRMALEPIWALIAQLTNAYLLFAVIILLVSAFLVLQRGFRAARFYLAAWVVLMAGGVVFGLFNFGLLPSNLFARNALSVSASLEMVLLFLAILDRYFLLRRESEKSRQERLEAIEKRLYSDPLTDLPNRSRLSGDLQHQTFVTIVLVNIDHFKDVNECFGEKAGDAIIKELGNRVQRAAVPYHGAVYRIHADQYAVVINSTFDDAALEHVGHSLVAACQDEPYLWEKESFQLRVSIGAAVTDSLHLEKAEMALSVGRSKKTLVNYRPSFEVARRYANNLRWLYVIRESIKSRLQALRVDAAEVGLTRREHEVAVLLSERLSMAEIADRLFISRRTVEKHAENIYLKLGIRRKQDVGEHLLSVRPSGTPGQT